ncbi:MAG: hypothetical protein MUE44_13130 [Oscillatoriaceae cyanobacterium Prado104]|jgi:hypothetical protein|nr:hypothetical protein [Oscillatoriaceae cyanobacterium Prado104]
MTATKFEMIICDLFHFQNDLTVFVGPVSGLNGLIKKCQAEVIVSEKIYKIIEIQGEFLPNVKHPAGHRAVSTSATIDLTTDAVQKQQCKLRMLC